MTNLILGAIWLMMSGMLLFFDGADSIESMIRFYSSLIIANVFIASSLIR